MQSLRSRPGFDLWLHHPAWAGKKDEAAGPYGPHDPSETGFLLVGLAPLEAHRVWSLGATAQCKIVDRPEIFILFSLLI